MRRIQPLLTLLLCLTVIATSVTLAVARGQMATGVMVQLCAGGQAVSVVLDAQGNPAKSAHHCPDCVAVTAGLPPALTSHGMFVARHGLVVLPQQARAIGRAALGPMARGPPVLI